MAGGFFSWLWSRLSAGEDLGATQKTLGGEPVVTLTIGSHSLDDFVFGYFYEEVGQEEGGLTIWLDNRNGRFDDLSTDYPDLKRGAAIDLRRGLKVQGTDTTEKLPRTWIEGMRYVNNEGVGLLRLSCIDWWGKLGRFRYASAQSWTNTEVATIASSILTQVGLTLASGTFGFTTDFDISTRRDGDEAIKDLMARVEEYLYAGADGEILHKELDPAGVAGYSYDWSHGGGANHPLLLGTEIAEASSRFNKVVVIGGASGEYSGSAEDATESALVGTRLRTLRDPGLSSDVKCAERAQAELRYWQAQAVTGTVVSRPHFTLKMYDMVSVAAPSWGGPAMTGRVRHIREEYGRGQGIWEQRVTIGGDIGVRVGASALEDGAITAEHVDESAELTVKQYKIRDGSDVIQKLSAEVDSGTGTTATQEIRGKDGTSPEGYFEIIAKTTDGVAHAGVASVVISLDTENGVIEFTGAVRLRMGTTYFEMTEQAADPAAPGLNRGRLYVRDNGAGKSQLCIRFNTGVIQVIATEP